MSRIHRGDVGSAGADLDEWRDEWWRGHRRPWRYPAGLACGPAFVAPFAFCAIAGRVGHPVPLTAQVAVLAGLVAVAGWVTTAQAGVIAIGTSSLSLNAFGENGLGVLSPHPRVDGTVLAILLAVWALAWVIREFEPPGDRGRGGGQGEPE
jgi:hypothetical protein